MKTWKRWISALLSLVLVLGMLPVPARAEEGPGEEPAQTEAVSVTEEILSEVVPETQPQAEETTETVTETTEETAEEETEAATQPELVPPEPITLVRVNPLYADITDDSQWPVPALMTLGLNESCTNVEEVAEVLREGMVARQEVISVDYSIAVADYDDAEFSDLLGEAVDLAMAHTGEPTEGDYIQWQYRRWQCSANATGDGTYWHFTITYMMEYGTDAEQEAEMDTAVANLLAELNPSGSDYNKIRTVYDYMTANITYDYDNLNDSSYFLKHTAYAALIHKTAVCQGYAVLLYRLALEMGIDCRVITGTSFGEGHAWNIVELDNKYYNLDSTWDAGETAYTYFLKSQNNFSDHTRDEYYTTASFNGAYPMGTSDYTPNEEPEPTEPEETEPEETVPETTPPEEEFIASGTCGENLTWTLDQDGVLTISGEGEMSDYSADNLPPWWEEYKESITIIVFDGNITSIGDFTFAATSITEMVIPDTVTDIGYMAFGVSDIKKVTISESVTSIADSAFTSSALIEVVLPSSLTSISDRTFSYCFSLEKVVIPDSVVDIGASAFQGCHIKELTIPASVKQIDANAFESCNYLGKVEFLSDIERIGEAAFANCGDLTRITFAGNAPSIAEDSFNGVTAVVYYPANDATWDSLVGHSFGGTLEWLCEGAPVEPKGTCGDNAFWSYNEIEKILTISGTGYMYDYPYDVKDNNLTTPWAGLAILSIIVEEGITGVGEGSFAETGAKTVSLPDGLLSIGASAFSYCSAESIEIPETVTVIGESTFRSAGLKNVTIPEGVTNLEGLTFAWCDKLETVNIPKSLTVIGEWAFYNCPALKEISIPENVESIGEYAFSYCNTLTSITIPAKVKTIGNSAFRECKNLTKITFEGDAPEFAGSQYAQYHFGYITATAYYPANNPTWTEEVRQNYGGTITWVAYGEEPEPTVPDETIPDEFDGKIFSVSGDKSISGHSQDEISAKFASIVEPTSIFAEKPSVTAPYAAGKLHDSLLQNGLTTLNYFRYVTRLPQVQLDDELNDYAQHGAVVLAANNMLTHTPAKPADMDAAFYEKGYAATTTSNISWNMGYPAMSSISVGLHGCLWDEDASNISRLGHRRWLLNPSLKYVGIGYATAADGGNYSTTKVFDQSGSASYDFVAFPASGNFPTNLFDGGTPWSVTLNPQIFEIPDVEDLTVTITRASDGKNWILDANTGAPVSNQTACLGIDYGGYGVSNCIIFSPGYLNAESYSGLHTVEITGLTTWDGQPAKLSYEVNFFDVTDVEPEKPTVPTETEHECEYVSTVFQPTCTEQGYTEYTCSICGETYRDNYTDAIGHYWKKMWVTRGASTTQEGEAYQECGRCNEKKTLKLEKLTEEGIEGVIIAQGAVIRPNANAQGDTLGSYELGAIVTVYETNGDWIRTGEGWTSVGSLDIQDVEMSQEERNLRRSIDEGMTEVTVDDSFTLSKDLYIPENVYLNIQNGCTMTVPEGVALDIGGLMGIFENSTLELADGGILAFSNQDWAVIEILGGTLDVSKGDCYGLQQNAVVVLLDSTSVVKGLSKDMLYGSYYVNNMADVNKALAMAGEYGYMQLDVTSSFDLTNSITIPENTLLSMYYEAYEVAALDGVTVTNKGEIWVRNGNLMAFAEGATLANNGYIYVDGNSALMMFGDYYGNGDVEGSIISGTLSQTDLEEALKYAGADDIWVHSFHTTLERNLTVNILFAMYRFGKLVVPDGVTLTLNAEFLLMPGAQIIVEDGGRLIVNKDVYSEGLVNVRSGGEIQINGAWDGNAPVYDHTHFYSKQITAPTCTEQGYTTYTCSCGDSYVSDYVPAAGHSYGDGVVTTKPDCETKGIRTYACACGDTYTEEIPATGHAYAATVTKPTCTGEGFTTYTCDTCGSSYVDNYVDALGHTEVIEPAVAATCTEGGLTEGKHCGVCGEILAAQTAIPALGHSFGDWYVTKEATTEAEGEERRDCANCDAFETRAIEKLPEEENPAKGTCGENLTWELADGVLTISGTGEMEHYSYDWSNLTGTAPWFELYEDITSVNIETGVTAIGSHAFAGCTSLASVTLPDSLETIGYGAFENCSGLTEITLPDSLTSIEGNAFHCTGLTSVEIPEGITSIASGTFWECTSLESVALPEGITSIDSLAFHICTSLKSITLPDSLTSIGGKAFSGCESLTSLTIPGGVETFGFDVFAGCTGLTDVVVQEGVTAIGDAMFIDCFALENVTLPGSLTLIDDYAFARCKSLKEITIPANVAAIDDYAFRECESLKTVRFEGDAPAIGDNTFLNVVANAYYPADNATWTSDVMKDYGGDLTWKLVGGEDTHDGKLGDVNHDGKINAKDATLILQSSVGVLKDNAKFCEECAEVSGDGKLNAKDSTLILQFSVGLRDNFPAQK